MVQDLVLSLNNNGVNALRRGYLYEAILYFRAATECSGGLLDGTEFTEERHEATILSRIPLTCLNDMDLVTASPSNAFEVYQCAFLLAEDKPITSAYDVVVIVLYNLALAHHVAGFRLNEQAHLVEALRYFKLALTTHKSQAAAAAASSSNHNNSTNHFPVILGCVANMGHLLAHFRRMSEVQSCCDMLEILLESTHGLHLDQEDSDFFFSALSFGQTCQSLLAPAA